ncbi:hypothetical protein M5X04_04290 [Paenibacillus alvei]|uniref:Uncharacterized protein n=1 Tax=Paenibacillus alvei TaxID=44250 RepID=A0ABT4E489_PAEAL|nr:hypothetical protein [Paenibacillus alvei]MCY9528555.1 hypothetical protein [Paenibacillus alvei]
MQNKPVLRKVNNYFVIERFDVIYKFDNISEIIMNFLDIDDYLCFCTLYDYSKDNNYIRERVIFRNRKWIEPWWAPEIYPDLAWYKTNNESEVKQAIENDQFFTCIVLKKDQEFEDYSYVISCIEDDIGDTLCIYSKNEQKFFEEVLPELSKNIAGMSLDI